jgi:L-ribulose-5-phosphate 4-epimerase
MTGPQLRERVAAGNVALGQAGLVALSFGNLSAVDRDRGVLLIKPSGVPCADVTAADVVAVGLDDGLTHDGSLRPSTDTPTHRLLLREFPEIGAVVHTHSPSASAWAQAGRPIPCLGTTHADYFRGQVPVTRALTRDEIDGDYEWETGRVIAEAIRNAGMTAEALPAVLVRSHGPFVWGRTPEAAVEAAIALETIASMAFQTLLIEAAAVEIGDELLARHFDRKHGPGAYYGQPGGPSRRPR